MAGCCVVGCVVGVFVVVFSGDAASSAVAVSWSQTSTLIVGLLLAGRIVLHTRGQVAYSPALVRHTPLLQD
jgi:hypothetical protein